MELFHFVIKRSKVSEIIYENFIVSSFHNLFFPRTLEKLQFNIL